MAHTIGRPESQPPTPPIRQPLIGDIVHGALSAVGVTQERVSSWLGKPCNCKERRAKLNQLELWALRVFGFKKKADQLSEQEKARLAEEAKADLEKITGINQLPTIAPEQPR